MAIDVPEHLLDIVLDTSGLPDLTPGLEQAMREIGIDPDALTMRQAIIISEQVGAYDLPLTFTGEEWTMLVVGWKKAGEFARMAGYGVMVDDVDKIVARIDQATGVTMGIQDSQAVVDRTIAALLASRS